MKIAILTHHWVPNFGANLQVLATHNLLQSMGHDVTVLDFRPFDLEQQVRNSVPDTQMQAHEVHTRSCLNLSKQVLRDENDLIAYCSSNHFDVLIAGSDSLFRIKTSVKTSEGRFPNPFWLRWTELIPNNKDMRCSFLAASSEGSYYFILNNAVKKGIVESISKVSTVTVRDRWTQKMISLISNGNLMPSLCPDPVSVLNDVLGTTKETYNEQKSLEKKYILLSASTKYLTPRWCKKFMTLAHKDGLEVYTLPVPSGEFNLPVDRVLKLPMSPIQWYEWIKNSAGIISINFHPIACSVFNNIPFVSIDISGPMYFRCVAIRPASKTYDLCMNVSKVDRSFLPLQTRLFLTPSRAMKLIKNWDGHSVLKYQEQANIIFKNTINKILRN